jgi:hypothetical protein
LNGDVWQFIKQRKRLGVTFAMSPIVPQDFDPMRTKGGEARENEGVADYPN